jgi:phage repressor protein C with HTH and peptisase S24 domain
VLKLRQILKLKNLDQKIVSDALGTQQSNIKRFDDMKNRSLSEIEIVAKVIDVDVSKLINYLITDDPNLEREIISGKSEITNSVRIGEENTMAVRDRLKLFIEHKGISIRQFEAECNLSNGYTNNMRKSIQPDKLGDIIVHFPDLNVDWLMVGRGEMLMPDSGSSTLSNIAHHDTVEVAALPENGLHIVTVDNAERDGTVAVPIVDINVAAGAGHYNSEYLEVQDNVHLPSYLIKQGQYLCVRVKGQSMAPTLQDSSYLIIRLLDRGNWEHMPNEHIYVVSDTEGKASVKRVRNRFNRGFIVCTSDNIDKSLYPSFNLNAEEIHTIWHVEWYLSARMDNINNNYNAKVANLEAEVDNIKNILGEIRLDLHKKS